MVGFIYRRAIAIKEFGECLAHIKIFGIRPLLGASAVIICIGLALRGWCSKHTIH